MFEEWRATAIEEGASDERQVTVPGRPEAFADSDGVTYRTTFSDPRESDDDVAVLEFHGLYAHTEIEVTGRRLDGDWPVEHDAYFAPLSIPFIPADDEENELVVRCHAPRDRFGGIHDTDLVPDELAVPGIWWDVSLSARPLPYVERLDVRPEVSTAETQLVVSTTVVTDEPMEDAITYSVKPEGDLKTRGMMQRGSFEARGPGKTTVEHTVDVHDPALWWPRGYGSQNRYALRAKLADDEHTVTTGICDVQFEDGALLVNGEHVPIRGVNLLTTDPEDIERALAVNANLVRAHAHVLPPSVYEACDSAGVLVWQDLPLTGPGTFDTDRGVALAQTLSRQYARHPSLAVYGVHDDPVDAFGDGLGSGFLDRLRVRWRAWRSSYDAVPAETIADALPERRPVFPVIGGPGVDADAASYYPGWDYGQAADIDELLERYPATVLAEYGAGALAGDTADTDTDDTAIETAGFDIAKHDRHVDDPEESQAYQADVVRTVTERLRSEGIGAIPFCLRDTDRAGMGVYSHDGTPKAAQDVLETAFEPTQVFLTDPAPGSNEVVVVTDRNDALTVTVQWSAGDSGDSTDVTVPEGDWRTTTSIAIPGDADTLTLSLRVDGEDIEQRYEL